jgi:hypothetical protein
VGDANGNHLAGPPDARGVGCGSAPWYGNFWTARPPSVQIAKTKKRQSDGAENRPWRAAAGQSWRARPGRRGRRIRPWASARRRSGRTSPPRDGR